MDLGLIRAYTPCPLYIAYFLLTSYTYTYYPQARRAQVAERAAEVQLQGATMVGQSKAA